MPSSVFRAGLSVIALGAALSAQASSIGLQTRLSTDGPAPAGTLAELGAYYRDTVSALSATAPTAGYCDTSVAWFSGLSNQANCAGSNGNIAMHIAVEFSLASDVSGFGMQFGPDFGHGGAFFLDGVLLDARNTDMWWNGGLVDPAQHFEALGLNLSAGLHRVDLYGLEGCCDGGQIGRFQLAPTASWQLFGVDDGLNPAQVPLPASLPLAALALGLALRPRRKLHSA